MTDTNARTENLFSYGTLQDEKVQRAVFGRTLESTPDVLTGFRLTPMRITDRRSVEISGKEFHTILVHAEGDGDQTEGVLLRITTSELEHADRYEPVEVKRIRVRLRSGADAWVYVLV